MRRVIEVGVIGAALLSVLLSCSYNPQLVDTSDVVLYQIDAVRAMEPQGPAFNQGLRQGYLDFSDVMTSEYDHSDYWHFAFEAVDSAKGEMVLPDTGRVRDLQPDNVEELSAARARLMAALDQTGRKKAPWQAAKAQTAFDCWLETAEASARPTRSGLQGRIRDARSTRSSPRSPPASTYIVFFAWDQADLTPVALAVLHQVQADFAPRPPQRVKLAGHADRSGSEAYNEALGAPGEDRRSGPDAARRAEQSLKIGWFGERSLGFRRPMASGSRTTGESRSSSADWGAESLRRRQSPVRAAQPPVTLMWRLTAGCLCAPVDDEVVALRLAGDRLVDRAAQQLVVSRGAQRRAQVGGVLLAEAHVESCRCR